MKNIYDFREISINSVSISMNSGKSDDLWENVDDLWEIYRWSSGKYRWCLILLKGGEGGSRPFGKDATNSKPQNKIKKHCPYVPCRRLKIDRIKHLSDALNC